MTYARNRHLPPLLLAAVLAGLLIPAAPCAAADCNNNGIEDAVDIITGISDDFDRDGTPDDCESVAFVDASANGNTDGTAWANAFTDLQDALALASHGFVSEIWVAAGTYRPAPAGGSRDETFRLNDGERLYGGFSGVETSRGQRHPATHVTILDGDLNGDDGPIETNLDDNSQHVVTVDCELVNPPIIDGFTITGGNAMGIGGGLLLRGTAIVRGCTFSGNSASNKAEGVAIRHSSSVGCYEPFPPPMFEACVFENDSVYAERVGAELMSCIFRKANVSVVMHEPVFSPLIAVDCAFHESLISVSESVLKMTRCRIVGTVGIGRESSGSIANCIVIGPVRVSQSRMSLTNCTVIGRLRFGESTRSSSVTVRNCILWPVSDELSVITGAENDSDYTRSTANITRSLIKGGWPGEGNLDADPRFVRHPDDGGDGWGVGDNDDFGDLHLRYDSPAIDAGTNEVDLGGSPDDTESLLDFDGRPRFLDDPDTPDSGVGPSPIVDIGAYEFALDGDLDLDFDVDLGDFLAVLACQRDGSESVADDCRRADLDGDGDVDLADLITFQARFTGAR